MLPESLIRYRRAVILALHLALIPLGYFAAFGLRFDFSIPLPYHELFWSTLPFLLVLRFAALALFGLHRGWWRHVSLDDLLALGKAITLSSGLFLGAMFMTGDLPGFPRSVITLDWIMALLLFGGIRFVVRTSREGRLLAWRRPPGKPTLIVGAVARQSDSSGSCGGKVKTRSVR